MGKLRQAALFPILLYSSATFIHACMCMHVVWMYIHCMHANPRHLNACRSRSRLQVWEENKKNPSQLMFEILLVFYLLLIKKRKKTLNMPTLPVQPARRQLWHGACKRRALSLWPDGLPLPRLAIYFWCVLPPPASWKAGRLENSGKNQQVDGVLSAGACVEVEVFVAV